jgi:RNase_H superfamily
MYKRLTIDELTSTNTEFFAHLKAIYAKQKHPLFKGFLQSIFQDSSRVYFYNGANPSFRMQKNSDGTYRFVDEIEKLEMITDVQGVDTMHNLMKNDRDIQRIAKTNKTILESLMEELQTGWFAEYLDKPFVTYDIETTYSGEHITDQYFEMAYSIASDEIAPESLPYKYIDRESMQKYCDYLLAYDGYIVGYNQIWFDNAVLVHNVGYGTDELAILNQKSLDLMLFVQKMTGKRKKLNAVAQALISSEKTLASGAEWANLLKEWKKTWDAKTLKIVKEYCKQDVAITLWVFLYFLKNQKLFLEGEEFSFDIPYFLQRCNRNDEKVTEKEVLEWLFW